MASSLQRVEKNSKRKEEMASSFLLCNVMRKEIAELDVPMTEHNVNV
jgi:hypothetical protein